MTSLRRKLRTPLRDLAGGRDTGNWRDEINDLDLPDPLPKLVFATARRVKFHRRTRRLIARGLAIDFAERLNAGESVESVESVADAHGTARHAARRITRDLVRKLPLSIRLRRLLRQVLRLLALAGLTTYAAFAILYFSGKPTIARHYAAEKDAPIAQTPLEQRAWPTIKRVAAELKPPRDGFDFYKAGFPNMKPDSPGWLAALQILDEHPRAMDELREAVYKPVFGYCISGDEDPDNIADFGIPGNVDSPLMFVYLRHTGSLRALARWLVFDLHVAAHNHDPDLVVSDFTTIFHLADHAAEHNLLVEQLVRIAIIALADAALKDTISEYPGLFTDSHLLRLEQEVLRSTGRERISIDYEGERLAVRDLAQRLFTDDGRGSGRICFAGFEYLRSLNDNPEPRDPLDLVAGPLLIERFGSREDFVGTFDTIISLTVAHAEMPLWKRPIQSLGESECDRIAGNPGSNRAQIMGATMGKALAKAADSAEQLTLDRDSLLTTIALHRFQIAEGRFPNTLSELVPRFIPAIPLDRFDGAPFRYKLHDGRPLLYSVGADKKDDNGRPMTDRFGQPVRANMNRAYPPDGDWILFPLPPLQAVDSQ